MKKHFLRAAIILAVLALPMSAFALMPIDESQMASVDGQAGVSIAIDNVKLFQKFDRITWTDTDTDGGSINLMGVKMNNFTIDALTDAADVLASTGVTDATGFVAQALTIDVVDRLPTLSAGASYNYGTNLAVAGVQIGLPTIVINRDITIDNITVAATATDLDGDATNGLQLSDGATVVNNNASFGSLELAGAQLAILGGTLEIAPH